MPLIRSKLSNALRNLIHTHLEHDSTVTTQPASRNDENLPNVFDVERQNYTKAMHISKADFIRTIHIASTMDKNMEFQAFNSYHKKLVKPLIKLFFRIHNSQLDEAIKYALKHVNNSMLNYALSVIFRHRPDMQENGVSIASHITVAPHLYFDMGGLGIAAVDETRTVFLTGTFDYDHKSVDLEHRIDYFRLDPGLNVHHRHWHEAYPDANGFDGDKDRDRSGELFYYMHSQMVSRYNFERVSVDIPFVEPISNFREPIAEPYFNKLEQQNNVKLWDSRPPQQLLSDLNVNGITTKIQDLELSRSRIYEAIDRGYVYVRNKKDGTVSNQQLNIIPEYNQNLLDGGIDILSNLVLASEKLSVNYRYYGSLHNNGHMVIGYSHDPEGLYYKQSNGSAMTMSETASRDPAFFRWHSFIDDIFERYKSTLPEYRIDELEFSAIKIESFEVITKNDEKNKLNTKWVKDRVDITQGVPIERREFLNIKKIYYDFTHLGHDDFEYQISITNKQHTPVRGVVRIFIAPRYTDLQLKEKLYRMGKEAEQKARENNPYLEPPFNKLRRMFIELDKFVIPLQPGNNEIKRSSKDSSVTVPFKQMFMTIEDAEKYNSRKDDKELQQSLAWCGCGWPEYLLIGKGTEDGNGLPCHLFVMVSDYDVDKVSDSSMENKCCGTAFSYCGVRDKRYPDTKPMGFPFDRNVESEDLLLATFLTKERDSKDDYPTLIENMAVTDVFVKHYPNRVEEGSSIKNFVLPTVVAG